MALDYASIGLRIRHARTEKDYTQDGLAELLGVSRKHLSLIETGESGISLDLIVDIANKLQVPISTLLADNLTTGETSADSDLHYILLDCTKQEEKIIIKTAQALKAALLENGVQIITARIGQSSPLVHSKGLSVIHGQLRKSPATMFSSGNVYATGTRSCWATYHVGTVRI